MITCILTHNGQFLSCSRKTNTTLGEYTQKKNPNYIQPLLGLDTKIILGQAEKTDWKVIGMKSSKGYTYTKGIKEWNNAWDRIPLT
jgi:hypothetical protein